MPEQEKEPTVLWQIARLTIFVVSGLLLAPVAAIALVGLAIVGAPVALIGLPTRTVESPVTIAKWVVIGAALMALAPAAIVMVTFAAFFLFPVALVCIPFMLPVFMETAAQEREHEHEHRMLPAMPAHAH
jgi:hypothetical protein